MHRRRGDARELVAAPDESQREFHVEAGARLQVFRAAGRVQRLQPLVATAGATAPCLGQVRSGQDTHFVGIF